MKNEKALDAYIATITEINAKLAALTEQANNHLGHSPEEINWVTSEVPGTSWNSSPRSRSSWVATNKPKRLRGRRRGEPYPA